MGKCRRQCYGCGTVFEPSRSRGRRHLKRSWSAGVRVGVTRESRAIPHERGSREGWGRVRGARGRERLRRRRGKVCRRRGAATVMLIVVSGVAIPRGITSAMTLVLVVLVTTAPPTHLFFPCIKHRAVSVMCDKLGV